MASIAGLGPVGLGSSPGSETKYNLGGVEMLGVFISLARKKSVEFEPLTLHNK